MTLLRAGGVAAVAVAVVLVVLFWPGGRARTGDVAGCAGVPTGGASLLHLVVRMPSGTQLVELASGRTTEPIDKQESWSDRSSRRAHVVVRQRGQLIEELLRPDDPGSEFGEPDPALAGLWTGYRQALASGKAKRVGTGTLYGHRVLWLQFAYPSGAGASSRVAVDRASYCPIAFRRFVAGRPFPEERVVLARFEPFAASDFRRRTPLLIPHGTRSTGHSLELVRPWLTGGQRIEGRQLAGVRLLIASAGKRTSRGIELSYGSAGKWIRIDELKNPPDRSEWLAIPAGHLEITGGGRPPAGAPPIELWSGDLVVNGIYTTIQTNLGRDGLLPAARAVEPV